MNETIKDNSKIEIEEEKKSISTRLDQELPSDYPIISKFRKLKFIHIISILVGLIIIVLLLFFVFSKKGDERLQSIPSQRADAGIASRITQYKLTATEILDYIDTQKTNDGHNFYLAHHGEICFEEGATCPFGNENVSERSNSWSALGQFGGYLIFENQQYKNNLLRDIYTFSESCAQNKTECEWALTQPALIYKNFPDPRIKSLLETEGESLLNTSENSNFMLLNIEARELALLYQIFNDQRYLNESISRLNEAKGYFSYYEGLGNEDLPLKACWYTLAAAELARSTPQNAKFLKEASEIISNPKFKKLENTDLFSVNIEPCLETKLILLDITGEKQYLDESVILAQSLIDNFWDSNQRNVIWGEGGIASVKFSGGPEVDNLRKQVNMTDTSYFVYLLALLINQIENNENHN